MSSPSKLRSLISWVVLAGILVAGGFLWENKTVVADEFRLIGYTPPAPVATLSKNIEFTNQGQRDFYASHPQIEEKSSFNKSCGNIEIHATILGCYTVYSIYIYNVTDSRLNGVQEVTAAHETLHAAYARLSGSQKGSLDAMLQRQYDAMSGDTAFINRFSVYNSLSQSDKLNELHSILGTEVMTLSSELENYYKQYFNDRSVVTGFYKAYQGQFDSLRNQQTALKSRIDALKAQIDSDEARYQTDRTAFNNDIQSFNQRANSGGYSSQDQFNSDRGALVVRSQHLNQMAAAINSNIDAYNTAIKEYNKLSIQTQDLQNSLDSNSVESTPAV